MTRQRPTFVLVDDRVVLTHDCLGEQVEATLNSADWRVVAADPLTVEPSVGCDRCGLHGWITNGWFNGSLGDPRIEAAAEAGKEAVRTALAAALADRDAPAEQDGDGR
jgi:hypothetical protein